MYNQTFEAGKALSVISIITLFVFSPDIDSREKGDPEAAHVINIDIQDNHEEATIGAFMICDLCLMVRVVVETLYSRTCLERPP